MTMDADLALRCLKGAFVLAVFLLPLYLMMRSLSRMARIRYGFAEEPVDDGPPLRVCDGCFNSVLEPDFSHCPYCGALLPPIPPAPEQGAGPQEG